MIYKKATSEDLNQLSNLFDGYRVFYKKDSDVTGAQSFLTERIQNNDSEIFVAQNEENKLVGFVQLYPIFSSTRMKKMWLLNDLFVLPEFRGQGVSIGLINKAKELAKDTNACALCLETDKTNTIGNQLYPKTGFELNQSSNFYEWSTI